MLKERKLIRKNEKLLYFKESLVSPPNFSMLSVPS